MNTNKFEYTTGYLFRIEAADINEVTQLLGRYGVDGWLFTGHAKDVMNGTFYTFVREVESETKPELVHFCEICQGPAIHKTSRHPWPNREIVKNAPDAACAELVARVEAVADEMGESADEWEATAIGPMGIGVDRGKFKAYRDSSAILRALVATYHAETDRGQG